jgi:hypothetical protein
VKILLFVLMAFFSTLFAVLQVADAGSAAADRGLQKEFEAIIAAVIGGCLLTGGYGSVVGAAFGALIFGMVQIGIGYTSIDNNWYRVFLGVMLLVAVLGLGFGVSLLAVKLGYSVALGAFLIGAIMAEARESGRIEDLIKPLRDMFSAVYFVAIGMLIDPTRFTRDLWPILICTAIVLVGKLVSCTAGAFVAGTEAKTSLRIGMAMGQIGEFSFIIAQLGLTLRSAADPGSHLNVLYPVAVYVSVLTTLMTPYRIRASDPIEDWIERSTPSGFAAYLHLYTNWIANLSGGDEPHGFSLDEGANHIWTFDSGGGTYQVTITPGSDTARWSAQIQDYY